MPKRVLARSAVSPCSRICVTTWCSPCTGAVPPLGGATLLDGAADGFAAGDAGLGRRRPLITSAISTAITIDTPARIGRVRMVPPPGAEVLLDHVAGHFFELARCHECSGQRVEKEDFSFGTRSVSKATQETAMTRTLSLVSVTAVVGARNVGHVCLRHV